MTTPDMGDVTRLVNADDPPADLAARIAKTRRTAPMADQLIPVTINFLDGTSETLTGERLSDHFAIAPHILPKDRRFTGAWRLVHIPTGHWMNAPDFDEATVAQLRKVAEILTASTLDWGKVPDRNDKEGQRPYFDEFLTVRRNVLLDDYMAGEVDHG